MMRALILGGSGHIGKRLTEMMNASGWCEPVCASRGMHATAGLSKNNIILDARDEKAMNKALLGMDCVVNCVAGDARSIAEGTRKLINAALVSNCSRIVHLSTMSVYGRTEGVVNETATLDPDLGWYAKAKCEAEGYIQRYVENGGRAVVLRPGCVYGPGSLLWVGRIGRWLKTGRLGDIGISGDGWSNLVHVDDVCSAILASLKLEPVSGDGLLKMNLTAPDSPRWNDYFVDLGLAINAIPVRRVSSRQLKIDAYLAGPPIKALEKFLDRLSDRNFPLPDPMPPAILRLFSQDIRLDSSCAEERLGLKWTRYPQGLTDSAEWFMASGQSHYS